MEMQLIADLVPSLVHRRRVSAEAFTLGECKVEEVVRGCHTMAELCAHKSKVNIQITCETLKEGQNKKQQKIILKILHG